MSDGDYDRLLEKMVADLQLRMEKAETRITSHDLWRNTVLTMFVTLVFIAGAAARDLVSLLKHVIG